MATKRPELEKLTAILDRLYELEVHHGVHHIYRMTLAMQLLQVYDLINIDMLLGFDDFNFYHDCSGINNHVICGEDTFTDCFFPRCGVDV